MAPRRDVHDPKGGEANLNGEMVYLWRAVDHEGEILESYITKTRDKDAALRFMKKALKRHGSPEAITTEGLRSYRAAMNELGNDQKQEVGRWANNRVEISHLPFRRREREAPRFRRVKSLQKVASVHAKVHNQLASPPFGSASNAISLIAPLTSKAARPHWSSGRRLLARHCSERADTIVKSAVHVRPTDSWRLGGAIHRFAHVEYLGPN